MTQEKIDALIAKGAKRWTKGTYDRLYINANVLGLECSFYNTGNIAHATFNGEEISNSRARQYRGYKNYIDIKTDRVHTDAQYTDFKDALYKFIGEDK